MPDEPAPAAHAAEQCPESPTAAPSLPQGWVRFPDAPGDVRVAVEIARVGTHRQRGLMYRTEMDADSGMLFSWPNESVRSFWMKNTCLPLDMLFISGDGVIVGVLEQVPTLNEAPRQVPCPAAHVLEVNAGWVRAHGVRPGQRVDIDS